MEFRRILKTSCTVRIRPKQEHKIDSDSAAYLNELKQASPNKKTETTTEIAVLPNNLGKSEKFSDKHKMIEVLKELNFLLSDSPLKTPAKRSESSKNIERNSTPSTIFHHLYRKVHTPYSPGVVRINSQEKSTFSRSSSKNTFSQKSFQIRLSRLPSKGNLNSEKVCKSSKLISKKSKVPSEIKEDLYQGSYRDGKKEGKGVYLYSDYNLRYKGEFLKDLPHGAGTLKFCETGSKIKAVFHSGKIESGNAMIRYKDLGVYNGEISNMMRHGYGNMEYVSGGLYKGNWLNDQRSGLGIVLCKSDLFFEGFFLHDYTDGPGVLIKRFAIFPKPETLSKNSGFFTDVQGCIDKFENFGKIEDFPNFKSLSVDSSDIVFISVHSFHEHLKKLSQHFVSGKFISGKLNGAGIARYGNFGFYIGNFKNGKREGFGKMTYSDPENVCGWLPETEGEYVGDWKDDKRHGHGTMIWKSGTRYQGKFIQDRRHNVTGSLTFINGDVYEGGFLNEKMEGKCVIRKKNGTLIRGQIKAGVLSNDSAVIVYPDGKVYEGEIFKMLPNGSGTLKHSNGNVYEGNFHDGKIEGFGRMNYSNGDVYEGQWENGHRHGKGWILYHDSKFVYEGFWENDLKEGQGSLKNSKGEILKQGHWAHNDLL